MNSSALSGKVDKLLGATVLLQSPLFYVQEGASLNLYGFDALIISSRLIPYFE